MPSGARAAAHPWWHALRRIARALSQVVLVAASVVAVAAARPAQAEETSSPRVVAVTVAGSDEDMDSFMEALREPLESLGLRVNSAPAEPGAERPDGVRPGGTDERARVWIDAREQDQVDVFIQAGSSDGSEPVHRTILRASSRAVVAEEVAYSVRAALESLLAPRPAAPPVAAPPAAAAAPPAPPPPPSRTPLPTGFGLDAAALGSGRIVASKTPSFGGGVALDLAFWGRLPWRPGLWIAGTLDAPFDSPETPEVALTTTMASLRAVPSIELPRLGSLRVSAGIGGGVDFFRVSTAPTDTSPIALRPAATYADPIVEAQVLARFRLLQRVGLLLAFTVDDDTAPHHFTQVDRFGATSDVLAPWTVRPAVLFGVCVLLTGASGCAGDE